MAPANTTNLNPCPPNAAATEQRISVALPPERDSDALRGEQIELASGCRGPTPSGRLVRAPPHESQAAGGISPPVVSPNRMRGDARRGIIRRFRLGCQPAAPAHRLASSVWQTLACRLSLSSLLGEKWSRSSFSTTRCGCSRVGACVTGSCGLCCDQSRDSHRSLRLPAGGLRTGKRLIGRLVVVGRAQTRRRSATSGRRRGHPAS